MKVNGSKKIHHANTNQKKVGVAILILDRAHIKVRKIIKDKNKGHYTMKRGSIFQKDITIPNTYAPNNKVSNYMGQKLTKLQGEID